MYTSLLAKGNYGAMETEYAEQTFVTQITSRLPVVYGQAQYEVQWSDTVMENKYVTKHLEAYGKLGYHPVDQQPQGETHTRVRWSPRAEPQSTLFQQENWIQLLEEYEARHPLAPLPTTTRRDHNLTNLQRQGIWEKPTQKEPLKEHLLTICTDTWHPDKDIVAPNKPTLQRGLYNPTTKTLTQQELTHAYLPTGKHAGAIENSIMDRLTTKHKGSPTDLPRHILLLHNRTNPRQQHENTRHQTPNLSPPHAFNRLLPLININQERNTSPLSHSQFLPTYWGQQM